MDKIAMKSKTLISVNIIISCLLILIVIKGNAQDEKVKNQKYPNVIYILADDLGYGDIGCYGQTKIQTPNLDRMAQNGLLFTQHYAGSSVCAPSRASLMTGLTSGHTQIRGNMEVKPEGQQPMDSDTYTIAQLMKSTGYITGIFGKWGLGYPGSTSEPYEMGFDEFYGYNCQRQAHSYYPDHLWHNRERVSLNANERNGRNIYSADLIHQQALEFIRNNKDNRFFVMLTYTLPHAELSGPQDSIYRIYENKFVESPYDVRLGHTYCEKPKATFATMVTRLDSYVGEILNELKLQGLDKNTLVIFSSDNGPHAEGGGSPDFFNSSGPYKGIKRALYEGGIHVPMIAWMPGTVKAGTRTNHVSAFWDVMPTLAELIGVKLPVQTDGISFLPTLLSKKGQKQHNYLYWEFHEEGGRQAIRQGEWKAIRQHIASGKTSFELYNLKNDPHEDYDLSTKYPDKVRKLQKLMDKARTESKLFTFGN